MEYLLIHRGGRGQSFVYELLYSGEGETGKSFLSGLIDINRLDYDAKRSGFSDQQSGSSRPQVGGVSVGGHKAESPTNKGPESEIKKINGNHYTPAEKLSTPSYRSDTSSPLAATAKV